MIVTHLVLSGVKIATFKLCYGFMFGVWNKQVVDTTIEHYGNVSFHDE
jgi:hypothetical protein